MSVLGIFVYCCLAFAVLWAFSNWYLKRRAVQSPPALSAQLSCATAEAQNLHGELDKLADEASSVSVPDALQTRNWVFDVAQHQLIFQEHSDATVP